MNRVLLAPLILSVAFAAAPLIAAPKSPSSEPLEPRGVLPAPEVQTLSPKEPRLWDFQGEPIVEVLRTMARAAKMNVVIAEGVTGTVATRIENKTPREAIDIIAESQDLIMKKGKADVYYVNSKNPPPPRPPEPPKAPEPVKEEKSMKEKVDELSPAIFRYYESMLDYQAKPETAQKIAKSKKALFDALIAEGFSKEDALRLILPAQDITLPKPNK